jgi:hypothetical protein
MGKPIYLTILISILLIAFIQSAPVPETVGDSQFCDGIYLLLIKGNKLN